MIDNSFPVVTTLGETGRLCRRLGCRPSLGDCNIGGLRFPSIKSLAILSAFFLSLATVSVSWGQEKALTVDGYDPSQYVDVALVLAVDVSRSMSPNELEIQRKGYAAAISDPQVVSAIQSGAYGRIALTFFEWAGSAHAREIVPWTIINGMEDAQRVSEMLLKEGSRAASRTSISGAIRHGMSVLDELAYMADRRVIDISGDGPNNEGVPVAIARDAALETGIIINGLPLLTQGGFYSSFNIEHLDEYYRACVIGGPASFVVPVTDWEQFPEAVRRKLVLEIGGLEPSFETWPWKPAEAPAAEPVQYNAGPAFDCLIGEKIWQRRRELFRDP